MKLFLSGPTGVGKSTVGRLLAEQLELPFVDLDEHIENRAGVCISSVFESGGEATFRELERETFSQLMEGEGAFVCALGGGAVTQKIIRRRAQFEGRLVTLQASAETIEKRLTPQEREHRPLIAGGEGLHRLEDLIADRADVYREAHDVIGVDDRTPAEAVRAVRAELAVQKVLVPLGTRSYTVEIGGGALKRVSKHAEGVSSCLVITDTNVAPHWLDETLSVLAASFTKTPYSIFEAGEENKNRETVARLWDNALASGLDRQGMVVALGGGVAGDLGGFVAATLFRGVQVLQLPTSVLAMVDSSVGGKSGFDHPLGKNLIGAFHQPRSVLCDLDFLATLPEEERFSGLAEVVKAAWLDGEKSVSLLEKDAEALRAGDRDALGRAVQMAVRLKARIVADDEREGGARRLLNLGHTVGHALEAAGGYSALRHGEAVSLGMVIAFRFAISRQCCPPAELERVRHLLQSLGLPTLVHTTADARPFLRQDKKRSGDKLAFVVPSRPGETSIEELAIEELESFLVNNFP